MSLSDKLRRWLLENPGTRIPLKHPPLAVPGEYQSDELDCAILELVWRSMLLLLCPLVCVVAWVWQSWGKPPAVWFTLLPICLLIAALFDGIVLLSTRKAVRTVRNLRLGLLAERVVGQQLERCRAFGYSVFHDIGCEEGGRKFNIDHLAVGPGGIFVVETKGKSKPAKGDVKIWVDGEDVKFANGSYDPKALSQAQANVDHIRKLVDGLLKGKKNPVCKFTPARELPIKGLLVYPGWFVEYGKSAPHAINLTNHELMVPYLRKREARLNDAEATELSELVGDHLREKRKGMIET